MKKEQLVYALSGVIIGIIIGVLVGNYSRPVQAAAPAANTAAPPIQQEQAAGGLPAGHPEINNTEMLAELGRQMEILKVDPENQQALLATANLNFDLKNFGEAINYYELALRKDAGNLNIITDLGTCYFYMNNAQKALQMYNSSLSIDPKHAQTLMNIGVVKIKMGDKKGAADAWEQLLSYHPQIEQSAELRAEVQKLRAES